jgi:bacillithiol system protein YtxJ
MEWNRLGTAEEIEKIKEESFSRPVLLFKHSARCSISAVALSRFEKAWAGVSESKNMKPYMINVINERPISNIIAEEWKIRHESPQALVINNGECVYNASHFEIDLDKALTAING